MVGPDRVGGVPAPGRPDGVAVGVGCPGGGAGGLRGPPSSGALHRCPPGGLGRGGRRPHGPPPQRGRLWPHPGPDLSGEALRGGAGGAPPLRPHRPGLPGDGPAPLRSGGRGGLAGGPGPGTGGLGGPGGRGAVRPAPVHRGGLPGVLPHLLPPRRGGGGGDLLPLPDLWGADPRRRELPRPGGGGDRAGGPGGPPPAPPPHRALLLRDAPGGGGAELAGGGGVDGRHHCRRPGPVPPAGDPLPRGGSPTC